MNDRTPTVPFQLALLKEVLAETAEIVAGLYRKGIAFNSKADGSPLTRADLQVNTFLQSALPKLGLAAAWLSEETVDSPARLTRDWLWVVDPLDGTKEFASGIPEFAVSVGLVYRQRPVLGGIVNPATNEGGIGYIGGERVFWGGLQAGPTADTLDKAQASVSRTEVEDGSVLPLMGLVGSARPIGSVAYKLLRVAAGQDDLTFSAQPKSEWDICGGVALLGAAGKVYRRFDGRPTRFNQSDTRIRCGAVAGSAILVCQFLSKANYSALQDNE